MQIHSVSIHHVFLQGADKNKAKLQINIDTNTLLACVFMADQPKACVHFLQAISTEISLMEK